MTLRIAALTIFATAVLAVGLSACSSGGGGGAMTQDQYFQEVIALDATIDQQFESVEASLGDAADGDEGEQADALRSFMRGTADVIAAWVDGLDDIEPPSEIREVHEVYVETGRAFENYWAGVIEGTGGLSTEELLAEFDRIDGEETAHRWVEACVDLQQRADEADVGLELDCVEG
jgi:hypothetical protein